MKIRNTTNNTIYVEDIDLHLPYKSGEVEELDPDILKKSKGLRNFIISGTLEVAEYDPNERIEASIMFLKSQYQQSETTEEELSEEIFISDLESNADDIEVRLHGIFYDAGGYGKVNRNLALKLHEAGIKIRVDPKKSQNQLKASELKPIVELTKTKISKNHISIDSVIPSFAEYSTGKYRILYTTIESYSIPKQFLECCQMYSEIWVTCVEPSTIIETPYGPKIISQINIGDYVISGTGEPKIVTDKRTTQYQGDMVEMRTRNGYCVKMTPWHRLYVRKTVPFNYELCSRPGYSVFTQREGPTRNKRRVVKYLACPPGHVRADEIRANDWVYSPKRHNWVNDNYVFIRDFVSSKWMVKKGELYSESLFSGKRTKKKWVIPRFTGIQNRLVINREVAYFLGIYAAEGSNDKNSLSLVMSEEEENILRVIQGTLKADFGLSSKIRKPNSCAKSLELRASTRLLCEFLTSVGGHGAVNKKVPSFLFTMSNEIKIAFLKGVLDGDGWAIQNAIRFTVISKELRNGCVSLMYDLNLLPSIQEDHKLRTNAKWNITSKHPTYSLRIGGKQFVESELLGVKNSYQSSNQTFNNHIDDGQGFWHKVKSTTLQEYNNEVIDITVEDNQTFCIQSICSHNSPWSASILKKHVDKPIYVIPAGSDPILYTEKGPHFDFKPNIKNFVFLSVFSWGYRKGYDVLLKAYFNEFDARDDVSLLISSRYQSGTSRFHRDKIRNDINDIMRNFPNKEMPHVVRYSQVIPEQQMPQLYRAADCFVLPSRGEGSNLCSPEASLCGLPVIMTNVSGQQMYLRKDNAFLIEMDRLSVVQTGMFHLHYWDGQKFPALTSPEVFNQLQKAMRYVVDHPKEAQKRNHRLQKLIKEKYTWNDTANAAIRRLRKIKKEIMK